MQLENNFLSEITQYTHFDFICMIASRLSCSVLQNGIKKGVSKIILSKWGNLRGLEVIQACL